MEAAFGTSFEGVTAHTGREAQAACNDIGAHAYAAGADVAFASSSPDPGLVAHELTHVVQQSGQMRPKMEVGAPGDAYEVEADAVAARVSAGESVRDVTASHIGRGQISPQAGGPVQGSFFADMVMGAKDVYHDAAETVGAESHAQADAGRLRAFLSHGKFGPERIDPGTHIGNGFDASYDPGSEVLEIKIKVGVSFKDGLTLDPSTGVIHANVKQLAGAARDGMRHVPKAKRAAFVAPFRWSGAAKTKFAHDLKTQVESAWSSAGTGLSFECTRTGWTSVKATVDVDVDLHRGPKTKADHAGATVYKVPASGRYSITSYVAGDRIRLSSNDAGPRPDNLLRSSVYFANDSAALTPAAQTELNGFAKDFKDAGRDLSNPVELVGHASSTGGAAHNHQLAQQRIDAVKRYLAGVGFTDVKTRVHSKNEGEKGSDASAGSRRVDLVVGDGKPQMVSAHEFGHAFGLADEYAINPGGSIRGSGKPTGTVLAHDRLAKKIGVSGAVAENNDDVMSLGSVVRAPHYATFGLGLRRVTGVDEWKVK